MRKKSTLLTLLLWAVLLAGCGRTSSPHPEWDGSWLRLGDKLAAEAPAGFELSESNDTLAVSGIWYAAWSSGEGREITNSEGEAATVYEAQLYLLVQECRSPEDAEKAVESWTVREAESYDAGETPELSLGDQSDRRLLLRSGSPENPYTHGAAAFAVRGPNALSAELLCSDSFDGDPEEVLSAFLSGLHYGE